eukprot:TRINITY_DN3909_c0_g2_i1.p1 TRINITY_DN3909_c0_g2~~TRINITY_DN3909_c0_g2_i1.p1  ORF type:complete len:757 (+),score=140.69 TRINITY_DN3909_c0_g2_i1:299-2272(+)
MDTHQSTLPSAFNLDLDVVPKQVFDIDTGRSSEQEPEKSEQSFGYPKKHFREHSYTHRSFDAQYQQFEGRYKTFATFQPHQGITKSEVVQYEEIIAQFENSKSFLRKSFSAKKRQEKVGVAHMILHGSCLYFFRQDRMSVEDTEGVRAVFVLDHCEYDLVPLEESTEAALDILPGGQQRWRVYLGNAENRGEWLDALQESSPYYSAQLITEARKELEKLHTDLEASQKELDATKSRSRYLSDSHHAIRREFEAEKADYQEQVQMLQDEQRMSRQLKNTQQGEFDATLQERDELEDKLNELGEQRDQLREERMALRRHCQKLESQHRDIKQLNKDKDREFKNINKQLAKQEQVIDKLKKSAENYKNQVKEMPKWRQRAKELESINMEMDEEINSLIDELEAITRDKNVLEDAVRHLEQQVQQLLKEREEQDDQLRMQLEGLPTLKTNSRVSGSSEENSGGTMRTHNSQRRKSDAATYDDAQGINFEQFVASDDVSELKRSLIINQEQMKQMQLQINSKDKQITILKNRTAAYDSYMEQEGRSKHQLEGEVRRLKLKIEEVKRLGIKGANDAVPTDPEMIKDPAFHLEFVLQHASELVLENEKLRASLAEYQQKEAGVQLSAPTLQQSTPTISTNSMSGQGISRPVHRKKNSQPAVETA